MAVQFAKIIDTISDLKGEDPSDFHSPSNVRVALVRGHTDEDDGGGGMFYWDPSGEASGADDGTTFASTVDGYKDGDSNEGLWRRLFSGETLNARWFGASPDKSSNTTELQAAIDALSGVVGGTLYIPPGNWKTRQLEVGSNVRIVGAGRRSALQMVNSASISGSEAILHSDNEDGITIADLQLHGNAANNDPEAVRGIHFEFGSTITIQNVYVTSCTHHGITLRTCTDSVVYASRVAGYGSGSIGFGIVLFRGCRRCKVIGCTTNSGGEDNVGIAVDSGTQSDANATVCEQNELIGNTVRDTRRGYFLEGAVDTTIIGNTAEDVRDGIWISVDQSDIETERVTLTGNTFTDFTTYGVRLDGGRDITIANNVFRGDGATAAIAVRADEDVCVGVSIEGNRVREGTGDGIRVHPLSNNIIDVTLTRNHIISPTDHGIHLISQAGDGGALTRVGLYANEVTDAYSASTTNSLNIDNSGGGISDVRAGSNRFDAGTAVNGSPGLVEGVSVLTTGIGDGSDTNLQAPAQGSGDGPASMTVTGWEKVDHKGTTKWRPLFE